MWRIFSGPFFQAFYVGFSYINMRCVRLWRWSSNEMLVEVLHIGVSLLYSFGFYIKKSIRATSERLRFKVEPCRSLSANHWIVFLQRGWWKAHGFAVDENLYEIISSSSRELNSSMPCSDQWARVVAVLHWFCTLGERLVAFTNLDGLNGSLHGQNGVKLTLS